MLRELDDTAMTSHWRDAAERGRGAREDNPAQIGMC
jgi:hypothetical protein